MPASVCVSMCLCVYMTLCVCLSVCLAVGLYGCLSRSRSVSLTVVNLSMCLFACLCLSISVCLYLSVYLPACLSVCCQSVGEPQSVSRSVCQSFSAEREVCLFVGQSRCARSVQAAEGRMLKARAEGYAHKSDRLG